jgi:hypothetical protein
MRPARIARVGASTIYFGFDFRLKLTEFALLTTKTIQKVVV